MDIRVLDTNPLYLNQTYRLCFRFSNNYPIEAPEVFFLAVRGNDDKPPSTTSTNTITTTTTNTTATATTQHSTSHRPIPIHPHIYSNGIICLDLLGSQGWSPVQNVESVCMSIQSMLTGNSKNERPPGDEEFVRRNTQRPRDIRFVYEDSTV